MDSDQIKQRATVLLKYLKDEQKELQALYALQALMAQLEQPASESLPSGSCCYPCYHFQRLYMVVCVQTVKK